MQAVGEPLGLSGSEVRLLWALQSGLMAAPAFTKSEQITSALKLLPKRLDAEAMQRVHGRLWGAAVDVETAVQAPALLPPVDAAPSGTR